MIIKRCGGGVAVFEFDDICEGNYGSPDYITICRNFHTVIIKNVKRLSQNERNTMKRFVTFVIILFPLSLKRNLIPSLFVKD